MGYHDSVVRRHFAFAAAALSFLVLLALLIWQGSFRIEYAPSDRSETVVVWAVSTFIFILTVVLAFMLFRAVVKAYIDRQRNREGSRIRSKLLAGALVLTIAPALVYVVFSVYVLNRHLDAWFSQPARNIQADLQDIDSAFRREAQERVQAETNWISLLPQTQQAAATGYFDASFFRSLCNGHGLRQLTLTPTQGSPMLLFQQLDKPAPVLLEASANVKDQSKIIGKISIAAALSADPTAEDLNPRRERVRHFAVAESRRSKIYQGTYFRLICLITLFVLFFATWAAQILSRQLSIPISALLEAAKEIRQGNLSFRVRVSAMDELATLVRAFNEMTSELEGNARELELRRRFTEAILESIPTGVISLSSDERIQRVNRALSGIFPPHVASSAQKLSDLFSGEDLDEIRYILKRAQRTGLGACQLEMQRPLLGSAPRRYRGLARGTAWICAGY